MKKNLLLIIGMNLLTIFSIELSMAQTRTFCPASPAAVNVQQADGSSLTIVGKGTSLIHYSETVDGYTLVLNNGVYEYAKQSVNGDLETTNVKANDAERRTATETAFVNSLSKHLTMSQAKVKNLLLLN